MLAQPVASSPLTGHSSHATASINLDVFYPSPSFTPPFYVSFTAPSSNTPSLTFTSPKRLSRSQHTPFRSNEKMSQQGDIQERIAAARREAESLKERIRAKRESSADTSRMSFSPSRTSSMSLRPYRHLVPSQGNGCRSRLTAQNRHATSSGSSGSLG